MESQYFSYRIYHIQETQFGVPYRLSCFSNMPSRVRVTSGLDNKKIDGRDCPTQISPSVVASLLQGIEVLLVQFDSRITY